MADLGSKYPVPITEVEETKSMKLLWIEARIKECEAKIAGYKRNILREEQLLNQLKTHVTTVQNSIDA
jgi:hypothetical protein